MLLSFGYSNNGFLGKILSMFEGPQNIGLQRHVGPIRARWIDTHHPKDHVKRIRSDLARP